MNTRKSIATCFVAIQFTCVFILVWFSKGEATLVSNGLFVIGLLLGLWAVFTMKFRVSIFPVVTKHQKLYANGPYRFIRHPMYTGLLLLSLSFVVREMNFLTTTVWMVLLVDLVVKLGIEERSLIQRFPEYSDYKQKTKRLVPFMY